MNEFICSRCRRPGSPAKSYKSKSGLLTYCTACQKEQRRQKRLTPEHKKAQKAYAKRWYEKYKADRAARVAADPNYKTQHEKYMLAHREDYRAKARLKSTGWSVERYKGAFREQEGKCAICRRLLTAGVGKGSAHADHDHTTNQPRAILCRECNIAIGFMGDSPNRLRKAALYLDSYSCNLIVIGVGPGGVYLRRGISDD